ncbi:MAG: hypothetical protein Q7J13_15790 [Brevundimonas sp.]|uniref:hypothetical protein n=1 Tax=Brevundimonas sp. TaxID=1871086 RepID=UPI002725851E|nr:hypothetical protein [Brevundimonas sp.]MDO9589374.1 hypothetical protein [Brevundimonas sp.]
MTAPRFLLAVVAAVLVACGWSSAWADTWLPATVKTYVSSSGEARFTVTPRPIRGPLAYFEDRVEGVEPAGQVPDRAQEARGKLERLGPSGQWELVWERPLVNDVSPVSALMSNSGEYVVTFDNWHSTGWGDDVVVIYNDQGEMVRSMALTDFLPQPYFEALPRSVSSIWWSGDHRIESGRLVLQVVVPTDALSDPERTYLEINVDLPTGRVQPPEGIAWEGALRTADIVNAARADAEATWKAERIAPLVGPIENTERAWHFYLREAFYRLYEGDEEFASAATQVLRPPTAEDYAPMLRYLREALLERRYDGTIMIGSMSEPNLSAVLIGLGAEIPPGSLTGNTLYIAVQDPAWPAVRDALSGSGADVRQLDPTEPIPQRPDRMPD